jgi:hypothetical protein
MYNSPNLVTLFLTHFRGKIFFGNVSGQKKAFSEKNREIEIWSTSQQRNNLCCGEGSVLAIEILGLHRRRK